jgi:hypothetical protein
MTRIIITIIVAVSLSIGMPVLATNTYYATITKADAKYFSIASANQSGMDVTSDFTVEFWYYATVVSGDMYVMTNRAYPQGYMISFAEGTGTDFYFKVQYEGNSDYTVILSANKVLIDTEDNNEWHHWAIAVDVSAKSAAMYKDGSAISAAAGSGGATSVEDAGATAFIGGFNATSDRINGRLDDLRIWSDIRTAEEIAANYDCELDGDEDNLVGYWKFDNNADDATANNQDLTNNNSVPYGNTSLPFSDACSAAAALPPVKHKPFIITF